jgi:putative transposase
MLAADLFERPEGSRGRPAKYERRAMVDACCYVLRTGCSWTMLPKSFPPWLTVHKSFSRWAAQGKFEDLQQRLRQQWRQRIDRNAEPTAAIIDSQSTRISPQGGTSGYDAGKKVKGRKRHLVVDTLGLLLAVTVTAASVQDRDGAIDVVSQACTKYETIEKLYADSAYAGKCAQRLQHDNDIAVEVVRRPGAFGEWDHPQMPLFAEAGGFIILPKRWVVERTHAWLERERRMVMHHDRSTANATAWAWLAQSRMLLRRLAAHV